MYYKYFSVMLVIGILMSQTTKSVQAADKNIWEVQSIDTMKQSRDQARNLDSLVQIPEIITATKDLGASHVAIGTPYDVEFLPVLTQWVKGAREKDLHIWFRGNFSGWEGWFEYPKLTSPEEHHQLIRAFILNNQDIFQDGDIFTPVPEPENGIIGDPRYSPESAAKFLQFLSDSQKNCKESFQAIKKNIECGYFSINGDIAKEIITPTIAREIAPIVIDHYVKDPIQYQSDIDSIHQKLQVPILIGEIGAPIPDIHGPLSSEQQSRLIEAMYASLYARKSFIVGVNYWVIKGGTTALYEPTGQPNNVINAIKKYYKPGQVKGTIRDQSGRSLNGAKITDNNDNELATADNNGFYKINLPEGEWILKFNYPMAMSITREFTISQSGEIDFNVVMTIHQPSFWSKLKEWLVSFWQ